MQKIQLENSGQKITGTLVVPKNIHQKIPGVLLFHGATSSEANYIPLAQRLAENGIAGLTINMRGHGTSEGDFDQLTFNDFVTDGVAAYDFFIKRKNIDHKHIGICGASMGAGIAALVSAERPVKSLVLRAPATYTQDMMATTFTKIMAGNIEKFNQMENIEKTPAIHAITQFSGSLLIIASERDEIIPKRMVNQFLSSATHAQEKKMIVITDATHQLVEDSWREEFRAATISWFRNTL